jgi:hypothetical protein
MVIFYTGLGCNTSGEHTEQEFLSIMDKEFTHKKWNSETEILVRGVYEFKDWVLPDDYIFFTLPDWLEYSGASHR